MTAPPDAWSAAQDEAARADERLRRAAYAYGDSRLEVSRQALIQAALDHHCAVQRLKEAREQYMARAREEGT